MIDLAITDDVAHITLNAPAKLNALVMVSRSFLGSRSESTST